MYPPDTLTPENPTWHLLPTQSMHDVTIDGDIYKILSAMQARRNLTFVSQVIMECYASLSRQANDILKAISGTMKWDHAESDDIRQLGALTPEDFNLHEVSNNCCVAYAR